MCIFFLPAQCPFKGQPRRIQRLSNSSTSSYSRSDSFDASFATIASSRSSMISISSSLPTDSEKYGGGSGGDDTTSSNASVHGASDEPKHSPNVDVVFQAAAALAQEILTMDSTTATTTTTSDNIKHHHPLCSSSSKITFGRCVEPASTDPLACARFQIRHRASTANPTAWFDACAACTEHYTHHALDRETRALFRAIAAAAYGEASGGDEDSDAASAAMAVAVAGGGGVARKGQGLRRPNGRKLVTGKYGADYGASTVVFEAV